MFVGHYAVALAAKAADDRAPLWMLATASHFLDIVWAPLIALNIEHATSDPSLPGSVFILSDMPWTHSLPAALIWSIAAMALVRVLFRFSWATTAIVGLTVFSHWALDFIVHRPDLLLFPGGPKVGLALWNHDVLEQAVEMGLLALCGAAWAASRKAKGRTAWPALAFIAFLVVLQIVALLSPTPAGPLGFEAGIRILVVYLIVSAVAALVDLRRAPKPA